jgi:hypothetical protein
LTPWFCLAGRAKLVHRTNAALCKNEKRSCIIFERRCSLCGCGSPEDTLEEQETYCTTTFGGLSLYDQCGHQSVLKIHVLRSASILCLGAIVNTPPPSTVISMVSSLATKNHKTMHYADTDESMVRSFVLTANKPPLTMWIRFLSSPPRQTVLPASKSL